MIERDERSFSFIPFFVPENHKSICRGTRPAPRLLTSDGAGIRNAMVMVTGGALTQPRTVQTGTFGYYRFDDLPVGNNYIVTVFSKRFIFLNPSIIVSLDGDLSDVNFEAMEQ